MKSSIILGFDGGEIGYKYFVVRLNLKVKLT